MTPLSLVPEQAKLEGHRLRRAGRAADRGGARNERRARPPRRRRPRQAAQAAAKVAVPKKIAKRLPVDQARANKLAGAGVRRFRAGDRRSSSLIALDIPAKAERAAGAAVGAGRLHRQRLPDRRHQPHGPRAGRRRRHRRAAPRRRRGRHGQGAAGAGRRRRDPPAGCSASAGSRTRASRAACPIRWSSTSSSARPRRCGRTRAGWR